MPTVLQGQVATCDSSISVCPYVFDHLISQNIKAEQYYADKIYLLAENQNLGFRLDELGKVQKSTSDNLALANQKLGLLQVDLDLKMKQIKSQEKKIFRLKVGIVSVGIIGLTGTTYFAIRSFTK